MDYIDNLKRGILGGLAGGVPFGVLMGVMGVLPMIGARVGMPAAIPGFVVHMMMSAAIGGGFGLFFGPLVRGGTQTQLAGLGYGALWWVLGPLTFMPWIMGMGFAANWSAAGVVGAMPSLMGHLLFGAVLGFTYQGLGRNDRSGALRASDQPA